MRTFFERGGTVFMKEEHFFYERGGAVFMKEEEQFFLYLSTVVILYDSSQ